MVGSAKTEYALRALVRLAHSNGGSLTVREIAQAEGLSLKYLERVMATLKRQGYVGSALGAKGGYRLTRPPDQIVCGDITRIFDRRALGQEARNGRGAQAPRPEVRGGVDSLWQRTSAAVGHVLDQTTIADLLPSAGAGQAATAVKSYLADCEAGYMFHI